jgi:hypothetical protein
MQKTHENNGKPARATTAVVKAEAPGALARPTDVSRLTTPELVARIAQDAQSLFKAEIHLAKTEVHDTVQEIGAAAKRFAIALPLFLGGYFALIAAAIIGLTEVLLPWAAALVVSAILLVPGIILVMSAAKASPKSPLHRTRKSLKQDFELAKDQTT